MKAEDFTIDANAQGYRILYKGHSIGGASILGTFKGRVSHSDLTNYLARRR